MFSEGVLESTIHEQQNKLASGRPRVRSDKRTNIMIDKYALSVGATHLIDLCGSFQKDECWPG